jgi:hypothetical protein
MAGKKQNQSIRLSTIKGIEDGLRLIEASLRLGEDHA